MQIVIAPNAFKNALSASDAASAIKEGLEESGLRCQCKLLPVGDGGDGTGKLLIERFQGRVERLTVRGPLGDAVDAELGFIDNGETAVIEMAEASGLRLLNRDHLDPLIANSYGTGQLINHALDRNVKQIIIALGGSATVDGASGLLLALGVKFLDNNAQQIIDLPQGLSRLYKIDLRSLDNRILQTDLVVLCDVKNKLLGANGAATVFGPQKGATAEHIVLLEEALTNFANVTRLATGKDMAAMEHGGAAGGSAAGLAAFINARLVNGIDYFLTRIDFAHSLEHADLVITGEGSIDEQTLNGKAPMGVATAARTKGIPVIGLAGKVPLTSSEYLEKYFDVLMSIGNGPSDLSIALKNTKADLKRTSRALGRMLII